MKITNMKEVEENLGKKVRFKNAVMDDVVTGKIVYGEVKNRDGYIVGFPNSFSVIYENKSKSHCTWCYIDQKDFDEGNIVVFETIEQSFANKAEEFRSLANNALFKKNEDKIKMTYEKILDICRNLAVKGDRMARISTQQVPELEDSFIVNEVISLLTDEKLKVETWLKAIDFGFEYMEITW